MKKIVKICIKLFMVFVIVSFVSWPFTGYGIEISRYENTFIVTANYPFLNKTFTIGDIPVANEINITHQDDDLYHELTNNEKIVYDALYQNAVDIWEGKTDSTSVNISLDNFEFEKMKNASKLKGVIKGEIASLNYSKIFSALEQDYGWLFWYDQRYKSSTTYEAVLIMNDGNIKGSTFSFDLSLMPEFSSSENKFVLNDEAKSSLERMKTEINNILSKTENMSTMDKIDLLSREILNRIDYDNEWTEKSQTLSQEEINNEYIKSSSIVSVFDPERRHDVVCLGYAQSFNALLTLSGIQSQSQSGDYVGIEENAPHAWNIITIDGQRRLFDLTNTEQGMIGAGYQLYNKVVEGKEYSLRVPSGTVKYIERFE